MPNILSIYTNVTKNSLETAKEKPPQSSNEDNAAKRQLINHWKNSDITREKVKELEKEIVKLFEESLQFAITNKNTPKILINLIKINTLQEILKSYAI